MPFAMEQLGVMYTSLGSVHYLSKGNGEKGDPYGVV